MKIHIDESNNSFFSTLTPETVEEASMLMRLANTAKREPVYISTQFNRGISCWIAINKKNSSRYDNRINNLGGKK